MILNTTTTIHASFGKTATMTVQGLGSYVHRGRGSALTALCRLLIEIGHDPATLIHFTRDGPTDGGTWVFAKDSPCPSGRVDGRGERQPVDPLQTIQAAPRLHLQIGSNRGAVTATEAG